VAEQIGDIPTKTFKPGDVIFREGDGREVIHQIQRHLAVQQYYIHVPSGNYIAVWDPALRNYGPLGYDYGGRMLAAWLER
jgi:hypothetical protein